MIILQYQKNILLNKISNYYNWTMSDNNSNEVRRNRRMADSREFSGSRAEPTSTTSTEISVTSRPKKK